MRFLRRLLRRLTSWATTHRDEERLRAEIEEHIAMQTADNIRAGLSREEARRQAILKFGPVESMKDRYRDQRGLPLLESIRQDMGYTIRRLRAAPAFTVATVLTLALGIGATTAIFTLVQAVMLKSLPVSNPSELYRLGRESRCCYMGGYSQDKEFSLVSYDLYKHLRDNTAGFSELAAFPAVTPLFGARSAGGSEPAASVPGEFVSGNYFSTFGINAYAGRMLSNQDDRPGAVPVAVISYRLWRERYGADPLLVGSIFNINDKPFTLVGITPPGFFGDSLRTTPPDLFLPLNAEPDVQSDGDLNKADTHWLDLIGRIQPGAEPTTVEAEMRVLLKQWLRSHWADMSSTDRVMFPAQTLYLTPGGAGITSLRERYKEWLEILMAFSAFVLLIVCANVANLMIVRGIERRKQIALSMALGAKASTIVRQSLIESIMLSTVGGAAGVVIAWSGAGLILRFAFPAAAGLAPVPIDASPSAPVLLFALIASLVTGIVFGIVPAWMATRVDAIEALRGSATSTARPGTAPRKLLLVFQAALSLVLLSAAGLLTTALQRMQSQDFGFSRDRRIIASINPRLAGYKADQLSLLYRRVRNSLESLPEVSSVALSLYSPLGGNSWGAGVWIDGRPDPGPVDDNSAAWDRVTYGYFETIGTPIIRGRGFSDRDMATSQKVAVVSEAFARKYFAEEDPLGRHFGLEKGAGSQFEIVGVVKDARYLANRLDRPDFPFFFLPEAQTDYTKANLGSLFLSDVVIETRPGAVLPEAHIRQAMASVDSNMPVISVRSLSDQVAVQFTQEELIARLTSFFALLSLVLASIGMYGVTAYNAGSRTSEIGVRVALGARRSDVVKLLVRGALGLTLLGLAAGTPLTLICGRLMAGQLHGMNRFNPAVTLVAILALALSALVAALIPAHRASLISPLDAIRRQ